MNNLNEEIGRIKQLFTEERLYGNLITEGGLKTLSNLGNFAKGVLKHMPPIKPKSIGDIVDYITQNADVWGKNTGKSGEELDRLMDYLRSIDNGDLTPYSVTQFVDSSGKLIKVPIKDSIPLEGYLRNHVIDMYNKKYGKDLAFDDMPDSYKVVDDVDDGIDATIPKTTDEISAILDELRSNLKPGENLVQDIGGTKYTLRGLEEIISVSPELKKLSPGMIRRMKTFLNNNLNFLESDASIMAHITKNKGGWAKFMGPKGQKTTRFLKSMTLLHLLSYISHEVISPLYWAAALSGLVGKLGINFDGIFTDAICKGLVAGGRPSCDDIKKSVMDSVNKYFLLSLDSDSGLDCSKIDTLTEKGINTEIKIGLRKQFGNETLVWILENIGGNLSSIVGLDDVSTFKEKLKKQCEAQRVASSEVRAVDFPEGMSTSGTNSGVDKSSVPTNTTKQPWEK